MYCKTKKKRNFYELFTMFILCTALVIISLASIPPASIAHKVAYYTEKIKYTFDGILNSLKSVIILCSAVASDIDNFKDILHQSVAMRFAQAMMDKLEAHKIKNH